VGHHGGKWERPDRWDWDQEGSKDYSYDKYDRGWGSGGGGKNRKNGGSGGGSWLYRLGQEDGAKNEKERLDWERERDEWRDTWTWVSDDDDAESVERANVREKITDRDRAKEAGKTAELASLVEDKVKEEMKKAAEDRKQKLLDKKDKDDAAPEVAENNSSGGQKHYTAAQVRVVRMCTKDIIPEDIEIRHGVDLLEACEDLSKKQLISVMEKITDQKDGTKALVRMTITVLAIHVFAELAKVVGPESQEQPPPKPEAGAKKAAKKK
jgi:hypothetical protein